MTAILDSSEVSLYDFCTDPDLFPSLKPLDESWLSWNTVLKVLSGKKLDKKEEEFFFHVSGGLRYRRGKMPQNVELIVGRKGGKSSIISRIGLYHTLIFDRDKYRLIPGEEPSCLIICPNFRTSLIDIKFAEGMLKANPALSEFLIKSKQTEQIAELTISNGCFIRLIPVTAVAGRGPATYVLILDEAAFFKKRGQFCDSKIFDDASPGMARFGDDGKYFILTSPGRKEGLVWNDYQKYFGVENDEILVLNGSTKTMLWDGKQYYGFNPMVTDKYLMAKLERHGESVFRREYMGEFVDAIASAYSEKSINQCVAKSGMPEYEQSESFGLVDPAGLSGGSDNNDDFVIAPAHNERRGNKWVTVIPKLYGWSANPGSSPRTTNPRIAINESIKIFKDHDIRFLMCDKYKIEWVKKEYEDEGFEIIPAPPKNELYLFLESALNSGNIEYPAHPQTIQQLKALERTSGRSGKDWIDHAREEHDDYANIVAMGAYYGKQRIRSEVSLDGVSMGEREERNDSDYLLNSVPSRDEWSDTL